MTNEPNDNKQGFEAWLPSPNAEPLFDNINRDTSELPYRFTRPYTPPSLFTRARWYVIKKLGGTPNEHC